MDNEKDQSLNPNEQSLNAHQRAKGMKGRNKVRKNSADFDDQMRLASSGRNASDKGMEQPSRSERDNEMASVEDKSFDPDTEPRKEGHMKMKHSPSVAEILPDGLSENASNERSLKRGSIPRSPANPR